MKCIDEWYVEKRIGTKDEEKGPGKRVGSDDSQPRLAHFASDLIGPTLAQYWQRWVTPRFSIALHSEIAARRLFIIKYPTIESLTLRLKK